jgi:molybdopterin-guanine dinucleotide biosynthesis protein A
MRDLGVLILAGGGGGRFGAEKAFFRISGKPMVQHAVERVSRLSNEIVLSCKSNREKFVKMFHKAKVIADEHAKTGALTGLVSALPAIKSSYVAVVTCDCPMIKPEVIELLYQSAKNRDGAVPRWPNGYLEPLQAVYKTERLRGAVEDAWKSGEMRLAEALERLRNVVYVPTEKLKKVDPRLESFLNVNSPQDIKMIEQAISDF